MLTSYTYHWVIMYATGSDSVTTQILRLVLAVDATEITVLVNTQLEPLAWMDYANASTTQGGTDVLASVREITMH